MAVTDDPILPSLVRCDGQPACAYMGAYDGEATSLMYLPPIYACDEFERSAPPLHQSTFVMRGRSFTGQGPNNQRQLDAPMSESFPMFKVDGQLADDEWYHA